MRWRGDTGTDQHAAARTAARPGRKPDGAGDRAADRQGGASTGHRPAGDPQDQRPDDLSGKIGADQGPVTSAFLKEALDKGAAMFNWDEKKKSLRPEQRQQGDRHRHRSGLTTLPAATASTAWCASLPDGKLHVHTGVGNLGTYSHSATARVAAEVLNVAWENVIIERGDSRLGLPWNIGQFGCQHCLHRVTHQLRRGDGRQGQTAGDRCPDARWRTDRLRAR